MLKSRVLTGALVTGAFVVASMFAAAPASAAPLPAGQQISVVNSYDGQYYDADNDTAGLTAVGTGSAALLDEGYVEITGIDVDDSGVGYAVGTSYPDGPPDGAYLFAANAVAGTLEYLSEIRIFFEPDEYLYPDECTAIDYTAGAVLLGCMEYGDFNAAYIGYWDFDAEAMLDVIELTGDPETEPDDGFDFVYLEAIAVDPIGGEIYVFAQEFDPEFVNGVYTASEDAGLTAVSDTGVYQIMGADFDRGGQLWATAYRQDPPSLIPSGYAGLATVDLATGDLPFQEPWANQQLDVQAITVWGGLPATGPADSTAVVVGGAALLLFGAILAVGATARRRATES